MPVTSACRSKMIPDPQPMLCQCSANGMQVSCDSVQMVFPHRLESLESRDPFNAWKEWKVSDLHASNSERTPKSTSKTSIQHARVPEHGNIPQHTLSLQPANMQFGMSPASPAITRQATGLNYFLYTNLGLVGLLLTPSCSIWQCVKTLYPCSSHQNSW